MNVQEQYFNRGYQAALQKVANVNQPVPEKEDEGMGWGAKLGLGAAGLGLAGLGAYYSPEFANFLGADNAAHFLKYNVKNPMMSVGQGIKQGWQSGSFDKGLDKFKMAQKLNRGQETIVNARNAVKNVAGSLVTDQDKALLNSFNTPINAVKAGARKVGEAYDATKKYVGEFVDDADDVRAAVSKNVGDFSNAAKAKTGLADVSSDTLNAKIKDWLGIGQRYADQASPQAESTIANAMGIKGDAVQIPFARQATDLKNFAGQIVNEADKPLMLRDSNLFNHPPENLGILDALRRRWHFLKTDMELGARDLYNSGSETLKNFNQKAGDYILNR